MRCKKHLHVHDLSSNIGVCASCLRERLFAVMAAQAEREAELRHGCRKTEQQQQQQQENTFSFPRSVSPYISRRKMDAGADTGSAARRTYGRHQRFFSTPQIGPSKAMEIEEVEKRKSGRGWRFSLLLRGIFRSKSEKMDPGSGWIQDPSVSAVSCTVSSSWFASIVPGQLKKQNRAFSVDENSIARRRKPRRDRDRGMSPARDSDDEEDAHCGPGSNGYSSESSHGCRRTPQWTPATARVAVGGHGVHVSGMSFCLSPLVRASPSRSWNLKALPPEMSACGESRGLPKPRISSATSFCKNRSRKFADFGRNTYSGYN